jgi:predicted dehydrogenase
MNPVKILLLGAGNRGMYAYAAYAKMNPAMMKIAAVAEPDDVKRRKIQEEHGIPDALAFRSWEEAFAKPVDAEAVIIATQDRMHAGPLKEASARNLHILCEKPIVPTPEECRAAEKAYAGTDKVFMLGYVLKYTAFFSRIRELLDAGRIGKLIGIDLVENVGHIHISHSFVRGNWRNRAESSPMILAKSCHDMDILHWFAGAPCESLSSYGELHYFKAENAPPDAPLRCLEGCPHMVSCPYHTAKIYLTDNAGWPANVISSDLSIEGRLKALEKGPYGRCVFHCDNDVVDHQTVSMRFVNGVTATFTMSGFTLAIRRVITLFGTGGEIEGDLEANHIILTNFSTRNIEKIEIAPPIGGHSGGDHGLITAFVLAIRNSDKTGVKAMVKDAFESHYMAFAAESSRLDGKTIVLDTFRH